MYVQQLLLLPTLHTYTSCSTSIFSILYFKKGLDAGELWGHSKTRLYCENEVTPKVVDQCINEQTLINYYLYYTTQTLLFIAI